MTMAIKSAIAAYNNAASMPISKSDSLPTEGAGEGFKSLLSGATQSLREAEQAAGGFVAKKVSTTDLVSAVSQADLQLQTLVSVRDRFVSALQDIMRMPI